MKRLLIFTLLLLLPCAAFGADTKGSALSTVTPLLTDKLYLIDDPDGTPASSAITITSLFAASSITGLSDVSSATVTAGRLLVADGSNWNSVDTIYVDPDGGNVGIGTAAPSQKLQVAGTVEATGYNLNGLAMSLTGLSDVSSNTVTAGNMLIANGTNFNSVALSSGATIDQNGVLTLATVDISSKTNLAVTGNLMNLAGDTLSINEGTFNTDKYCQWDGSNLVCNSAGTGATSSLTGLTDVSSATVTEGSILVADGGSWQSVSNLYVSPDAGGNVGVGTVTPSAKFEVNGAIAVGGSGQSINNQGAVFNENGGATLLDDTRIESDTNEQMVFVDASANNVGIGTSTPSATLDVNGDISGNVDFKWIIQPQQAKLPASNPMVIDAGNTRWRGLFDTTTDECAQWETELKHYNGGALQADIIYSMVSANSGTAGMEIYLDCISDDADVDTESFGTADDLTATVPGTAGLMGTLNDTSLNGDSCAEGDLIVLKICRDADDNDTAAGDLEFRKGIIYE